MCAKAAGAAKVIALEMSSARKAKAKEVGASVVLDPSQCDALAEIRALTAGLGADVSFECIGNKLTAKLAIDTIRKAGKCVLVGIFEDPASSTSSSWCPPRSRCWERWRTTASLPM